MATTDVSLHEASGHQEQQRVTNDMSIQVATVNGSGSQSSNTVLLRSIFQMGVPVSGKNLFPSNIAGLPTWYTIRKPCWTSRSSGWSSTRETPMSLARNCSAPQPNYR